MLTISTESLTISAVRRQLSGWRHFCGHKRGSVLVELAFTIPILAAILVGGVEIGRYLLIHQKLSRLADSTSDLVAQKKTISTTDLDDIMVSAKYLLHPFELGSDGIIHVSSVSVAPSEDPEVDWQHSGAGYGHASSTLGIAGGTAHLPEGFIMDDGENIIVAEVFYDYRPTIFEMFTSSRTLYYRSIDRPRFGPLSQLN